MDNEKKGLFGLARTYGSGIAIGFVAGGLFGLAVFSLVKIFLG